MGNLDSRMLYSKEETKTYMLEILGEDLIDNEFLDKYLDILYNNDMKTPIPFKTQRHHGIPVSYYKNKYNCIKGKDKGRLDSEHYADADLKNPLVNLLYKDHVLAHYYFALCTRNKLQYDSQQSVFHVLGNINYIKDDNYTDEKMFIQSLEYFQKIYEESAKYRSRLYLSLSKEGKYFMKGKHLSEEHKAKARATMKGRIHIYKDGIYKFVKPDQWPTYESLGWIKKSRKATPQECSRIGEKNKGRIYVYRPDTKKIRFIKPAELESMIKEGWTSAFPRIYVKKIIEGKIELLPICEFDLEYYMKKGYSKALHNNPIYIYKGDETKRVLNEDILKYIKEGWTCSKYYNSIRGNK